MQTEWVVFIKVTGMWHRSKDNSFTSDKSVDTRGPAGLSVTVKTRDKWDKCSAPCNACVHTCFKPLQKQSVDIKTKWLWEALHDLCQNLHISNPKCLTKLTNAFFLDPLLKSVFLVQVVFSYVWYDTSIRATINYLHIHFRSNQRRNSIQSLTPSPSPHPPH